MKQQHSIRSALSALVTCAAPLLGACGSTGGGQDLGEREPAAYPWEGAEDPVQAALLSRDGGVVDPPGSGLVSVGAPPRHGVQTSDEGRLYIVELYQQALDERDSLRLEVDGLIAALEATQSEVAALAAALEAERAEVARLGGEIESLSGENFELAGRLATAHLRRLEAEKLLLEERLRVPPAAPALEPVAAPAAPAEPASALPPSTASGPARPSAWDAALGGGVQ